MKKQWIIFPVFLFVLSAEVAAQTTFNLVYNLLQAQCTAGCHSGSSPSAQLDLSGLPSTVYNNIVNRNPVNATALAKGDKLVMPGYPHKSFLLRKCDNVLDPDNGIETSEGDLMPGIFSPLINKDLELIRQWILNGAPQFGNPVDTAVINKYYNGFAITSPPTPYPAPTEAGAFQIHVGKIFVAPASEYQFYIKQDLHLQDTIEVNRIDVMMGDKSHHFNMLKFNPGVASSFAEGFRDLTGTSHLSAEVIGAFQHSYDLDLPPGTAYQWDAGMVLDINFHIINTSPQSVLAVDLYINVYSQPKGTAQDIMHIKWYQNYLFAIPWDNTNHLFTASGFETTGTELWDVWMMSSHTHKYGTDFDIYYRNPNGTEGPQIYEGQYNAEYTFNQNFYDWQHPPRKYFQPTFLTINPREGFIYKTTYKNISGPALVIFGATSADEMMIMYVHYIVKRESTGMADIKENPFELKVSPNPSTDFCEISYSLPENSNISLEVLNVLGEKVCGISSDELKSKGNYTQGFNPPSTPGIYFIKLAVNGRATVKSFIVAD